MAYMPELEMSPCRGCPTVRPTDVIRAHDGFSSVECADNHGVLVDANVAAARLIAGYNYAEAAKLLAGDAAKVLAGDAAMDIRGVAKAEADRLGLRLVWAADECKDEALSALAAAGVEHRTGVRDTYRMCTAIYVDMPDDGRRLVYRIDVDTLEAHSIAYQDGQLVVSVEPVDLDDPEAERLLTPAAHTPHDRPPGDALVELYRLQKADKCDGARALRKTVVEKPLGEWGHYTAEMDGTYQVVNHAWGVRWRGDVPAGCTVSTDGQRVHVSLGADICVSVGDADDVERVSFERDGPTRVEFRDGSRATLTSDRELANEASRLLGMSVVPMTIAAPVGRCLWCDKGVPGTEAETLVYCSDKCRGEARVFARNSFHVELTGGGVANVTRAEAETMVRDQQAREAAWASAATPLNADALREKVERAASGRMGGFPSALALGLVADREQYDALARLRVRLHGEQAGPCPDCNGSEVYVGLTETRPCPTCQGDA